MSNEKDLAVTKFLERPENFSDLFNGSLFQGKQVIKHPATPPMLFLRWKGRGKPIMPCRCGRCFMMP